MENGISTDREEWDEETEEERPLSFWSRVRICIGQFILPDFYRALQFKALKDVIRQLDAEMEVLSWEVCTEQDHDGIRKVAAAQAGKEVIKELLDGQLYGAASGYYLHLKDETETDEWLRNHLPRILIEPDASV